MINRKTVLQPSLSEENLKKLNEILEQALDIPEREERAYWITNKIAELDNEILDSIKLRSILLLLRDLFLQGWDLKIENKIVSIQHPETPENIEKKQWLRESLFYERNKQLESDSFKKFILRMERQKKYKGKVVTIKSLTAPVIQLLSTIQEQKADAIRPYLQIIQNKTDRDEHTGYRLLDIWRYFRLTWTLPHKSTPGRNIFVLVRDSAQDYHPVIGIAALGSSIVQITCRDNEIGWTIESLRERLQNMDELTAQQVVNSLSNSIERSILEIQSRDLINEDIDFLNVNEYINDINEFLKSESDTVAEAPKITSNFNNADWNNVCRGLFYKKKRAKTLLKLFKAQDFFNLLNLNEPQESLQQLVQTSRGRSALSVALQSNKREKVGANIMDIIVCGAVPPYNFLLGGKLTALLMMSPQIIQAYEKKYRNQVSVIASAMKGEPVIKPAQLVFLGTTSLYESGSSQYNRLNIPSHAINSSKPLNKIGYQSLGLTKGFGTVYISDETVESFSELTTKIHGRRIVSNTFGEGTSPRMRLIRAGLDALGLPSDYLLNHSFRRIVYGIKLAENAYEYLRGEEDSPEYYLCQNNPIQTTEEICGFWRERWLSMRIKNHRVMQQLHDFNIDNFLLGSK
ncbi:Druantia anti-phage system protein DruA [Paenibacillus sp. KS-LC4]|uniref:Druantia anti-phage system protein DruA n=1 Tax=Paenibacillus sp. KS-LC4 TaxID=2979727 RepID=UPI0030D3F4DA